MKDYKKDFPILSQDIAYLDSSSTEQKPQCVIDAVDEFYKKHNANPLRGLYSLAVDATNEYESSREAVRKFIGADSCKEIIFTRNTTESINLVAYSYALDNLSKGDEIAITIAEHHSNMLPWQMVAKKTGATLRFIECEKDGSFLKESLDKNINSKTKLLAMVHISNVLGSKLPIEYAIKRVHEQGGIALVDAAQSAPHIPINVKELDADFLAFSGHKMLGPMGIGVLYGKKALLDSMSPFLRGGEMIEYVTTEGATYAELPHKFEAGTVDAAGAVGLRAAIEYINSIGLDNIEKREAELTSYCFERLKSIPHVNIIGSDNASKHCGIITFTIDDVHPHDIAAITDSDRVCIRAGHHCAQPLHKFLGIMSSVRASIAFYNDENDIDRFIASIASVRRRMGYGD